MNILRDTTGATLGLVNCDWLSFSVTLCETTSERDRHEWVFHDAPPGYRLVEFDGTNIYKRRLICYSEDGEKIFTLLCQPHSRAIPRESALVQIANKWLYLGHWHIFDLINEVHPCYWRCCSRLDVCCDFVGTPERISLIKDLDTNRAYVQGKGEGGGFVKYQREIRVERIPKELTWGSKNSNIRWKVYNKSGEIFEFDSEGHRICHKPYIADQWHAVEFDDRNVWRIEVSINPMHKFEYHGRRTSWKDTWNGLYLEDLFVSMYMNRFIVRRNEGHKDRSNDRRVHLLADLGQCDRLTQWKNPNPKNTEVVEYASCLNAAMAQLQKPEVAINPQMFDVWKHTAVQCVRLGRLESYFLNAYGQTIEEFFSAVHPTS